MGPCSVTVLDRLAGQLGLITGATLASRPPPEAAVEAAAPRLGMGLPAMDFVVIDVETANGRSSSICQIGIVGFCEGREVLAWESLVDPQDTFAAFNVRLHGIGPERVCGAPRFPQLHGGLCAMLNARVTVAHSNFDQGALGGACRIAGLPTIQTRWLDSVQVARHAWPELDSHRLNLLAGHLGLTHRHHDALSDARVAGQVLVAAMEKTGLDLDGWLAAPWRGTVRRPRAARALRPEPAATGPWAGLRAAVLGEPPNGPAARMIAAAGGRVTTGVNARSDYLVVAETRPFSDGIARSVAYRRAEALIALGQALRIVSAAEAQALIADAST